MLSKLGVFNYVLKRVLFIHIYVVCPADQAALGRVFLERPELLEQYLPGSVRNSFAGNRYVFWLGFCK